MYGLEMSSEPGAIHADRIESYRILNSSYHNLTILTYDHVLQRARKICGLDA